MILNGPPQVHPGTLGPGTLGLGIEDEDGGGGGVGQELAISKTMKYSVWRKCTKQGWNEIEYVLFLICLKQLIHCYSSYLLLLLPFFILIDLTNCN